MAAPRLSGTDGYAEEAETLLAQYESINFADVHRQMLHLIPAAQSRILDVGAGNGRDAAGLAALGHRVLAVEPTAALRIGAMALHPSPRIEWVASSPSTSPKSSPTMIPEMPTGSAISSSLTAIGLILFFLIFSPCGAYHIYPSHFHSTPII